MVLLIVVKWRVCVYHNDKNEEPFGRWVDCCEMDIIDVMVSHISGKILEWEKTVGDSMIRLLTWSVHTVHEERVMCFWMIQITASYMMLFKDKTLEPI